jgi:hypothetical protein
MDSGLKVGIEQMTQKLPSKWSVQNPEAEEIQGNQQDYEMNDDNKRNQAD